MTLIEKLKVKSNECENEKEKVIKEIKSYFDNYFDNVNFEQWLEKTTTKEEIQNRELYLSIEFWGSQACGGSGTYFSCCGKKWKNQEDPRSNYYKGIYLKDIQFEICNYLQEKLLQMMKNLGFEFVRKDERITKSRFGYFHTLYYFGW